MNKWPIQMSKLRLINKSTDRTVYLSIKCLLALFLAYEYNPLKNNPTHFGNKNATNLSTPRSFMNDTLYLN
jgi:hypothetical protein